MNILVSACLLGTPCRYDGTGKLEPALERLRAQGHTLVPVCLEVLGGLPTPRPPAERQPDGRVVTREGADVTAEYRAGAERPWSLPGHTAAPWRCSRSAPPPAAVGRSTTGPFPTP